MIGFGFSRIYPLTLAILFIMGIAGMFWVNAIINLFQREAIGDMRGRVMSLYTIGIGLFPLGWAFGGALSALIGNELNPNSQRHRRHIPNPPSHAPRPRPETLLTNLRTLRD